MDHKAAKAYILDQLRRHLPDERRYHSLAHTLDVYAVAIDIGEKEGISEEDMTLLKTAALFHDAGFLRQKEEHERLGCEIMREVLPAFGFGEEQLNRMCAMVMATKIPQDPKDELSCILCDADLDYLGRPDFFTIGDDLFHEMMAYGRLKNEREWNELQVQFLTAHRYFTATNQRDREPGKQAHLKAVKKLLASSDKGT